MTSRRRGFPCLFFYRQQLECMVDPVNVASRMESHGIGGTIQITRATYELIKDEFVCEPRGTVDVKGKGEMEVWLVHSSKENLVEAGV